jgi:hypothetical protein
MYQVNRNQNYVIVVRQSITLVTSYNTYVTIHLPTYFIKRLQKDAGKLCNETVRVLEIWDKITVVRFSG